MTVVPERLVRRCRRIASIMQPKIAFFHFCGCVYIRDDMDKLSDDTKTRFHHFRSKNEKSERMKSNEIAVVWRQISSYHARSLKRHKQKQQKRKQAYLIISKN